MSFCREIEEIPEAVRRLARPELRSHLAAVATKLRDTNPNVLVTVARGSSAHAATYLKYAAEHLLGMPVAPVGPSSATLYQTAWRAEGLAVLAVSQSGGSEDLSMLSRSLQNAGAGVVALTNTLDSPLAHIADDVIDVSAGPEQAVAATKSFVNSVVAGLWLIGLWAEDDALLSALDALPDALEDTAGEEGSDAVFNTLETADHAVILGRGVGLGLASECALKLIETCGLHASAYSAAEFLHGPRAMLSDSVPVITLPTGAEAGFAQAMHALEAQGVAALPLVPRRVPGHPLVDPLCVMPQLYRLIARLSAARGRSVDAPAHLSKVTDTR